VLEVIQGPEWLVVALLVVVLAAVQSVFGVGLLVFGTPVLLLLGVPFAQVLAWLLPCSIVVNALQVATTGGLTLDPLRRNFLTWAGPTVVLATAVTLVRGTAGQVRLLVGMVLILSAALRTVGPAQELVRRGVRAHVRPVMVLLGLVHGVSNLGGGLLTAIVGSSYDEKATIRSQIAFCYGGLASLQLVVLLITRPDVVSAPSLLLPILAAATFRLIGQRVFRRAQDAGYQRALTTMILGVGVLLVST
jgi:uncharacterized membrane protein YfcA